MATGVALVVFVFGLALWLAPASLVYVHASNRGRDAVLWALITLVGGLLGMLLYFVVGGSTGRDTVGQTGLTSTVRCPDCGRRNGAGADYCTECGTTLTRSCPQCGSRVGPDDRYCADCGASLGTA